MESDKLKLNSSPVVEISELQEDTDFPVSVETVNVETVTIETVTVETVGTGIVDTVTIATVTQQTDSL